MSRENEYTVPRSILKSTVTFSIGIEIVHEHSYQWRNIHGNGTWKVHTVLKLVQISFGKLENRCRLSEIESYDTSIPIYTKYMPFDILQLILRLVACFQPYLFYPRPTNDVQPLSFFPSINEQEIELRKKSDVNVFHCRRVRRYAHPTSKTHRFRR